MPRVAGGFKAIMTANENRKKTSQGYSRPADYGAHQQGFSQFFERGTELGGDWKRILRARVGAGDERKF